MYGYVDYFQKNVDIIVREMNFIYCGIDFAFNMVGVLKLFRVFNNMYQV